MLRHETKWKESKREEKKEILEAQMYRHFLAKMRKMKEERKKEPEERFAQRFEPEI